MSESLLPGVGDASGDGGGARGGVGGVVGVPAGMLTARLLAGALGVSRETVNNWVIAGMPVAGDDASYQGKSVRYYDLAACRDWVRRHRGSVLGVGSGGVRPGGGRPPGRPKGSKSKWRNGVRIEPADVGGLLDGGATEAPAPTPPRSAPAVAGEEAEPDEEGQTGGGSARQLQLAKAETERLKAQAMAMELAKKRGELLPAGEVKRVWEGMLVILAARLNEAPSKIAVDAAAVLGLVDDEQRIQLEDVVRDEMGRIVDELVRGASGGGAGGGVA